MGILDVIKRWFGGSKTAPAKPSPPPRTQNPDPAVPAPKSAQPVQLSAHDAIDALAAKAAAKPSAFNERRERPRVNARDGTRVLIIDDSPTIVALLKRMLEQNGYKAMDAVDAETGIALAISDTPDLIFLDIVLPGMNGFEALRRLRRDPATKITPIVMISGNELATEQFYAQRIGADDFMKKPFSRSEVFARIERLLDAEKVPRRHLAVVKPLPAAEGAPAPGAATAIAEPIQNSVPVVAEATASIAPAPLPAPVVVPVAAAVAAAPVVESPNAESVPVVAVDVPAEPVPAILVAPEAVAEALPGLVIPEAAPDEPPAAIADQAPVEEAALGAVSGSTPVVEESAAHMASTDGAAPPPSDEPAPVEIAASAAVEPADESLPQSEAAIDAIAEPVAVAPADPAKTMIIEETLRAPANEDVRDPSPMPLAAVSSVVAPPAGHIPASDAVMASEPVSAPPISAVASMPPAQGSSQHVASN